MADSARRRVVVTGARSPLGRRLLDALHKRSEVEFVRGLEARPARRGSEEPDLDIVPFSPDHRPFVEYLARESIDTVIQIGLAPDRTGFASSVSEADVIGTMSLGAAIGSQGGSVRCWVVASSSAVYPIASNSPRVASESLKIHTEQDSFAASILEAEDYARDMADRATHINVSILRLQQLVGKGVEGHLASLLERDRIPSAIGFDASIQLLHVEDAARALAFASMNELAGVFNVASGGLTHWAAVLDRCGGRPAPVLPMAAAGLEPILDRLGVPFLPAALVDLLRHGLVIDLRKIEKAGWKPRHDQASCLEDYG
ncbi:MAG: NAD-dependent epimerase/dehydratase family protein [bacterium]|nr:NAD-dependent epimerase/dehydratase family protein [bacterium]